MKTVKDILAQDMNEAKTFVIAGDITDQLDSDVHAFFKQHAKDKSDAAFRKWYRKNGGARDLIKKLEDMLRDIQ